MHQQKHDLSYFFALFYVKYRRIIVLGEARAIQFQSMQKKHIKCCLFWSLVYGEGSIAGRIKISKKKQPDMVNSYVIFILHHNQRFEFTTKKTIKFILGQSRPLGPKSPRFTVTNYPK